MPLFSFSNLTCFSSCSFFAS